MGLGRDKYSKVKFKSSLREGRIPLVVLRRIEGSFALMAVEKENKFEHRDKKKNKRRLDFSDLAENFETVPRNFGLLEETN